MSNRARERSIDNLQRIYTVVVSLAMTESLRRLLSDLADKGQPPSWVSIIATFSLVVTIIPFYHGANRYLDATYVNYERSAKAEALMLDFIVIFFEGIVFFVLAIFTSNKEVFFTVLALLFIGDAVWVGLTRLLETDEKKKTPGYWKWATLNVFAAFFILISIWSNVLNQPFWQGDVVQIIAVGIIALVRSAYDYLSVWNFYYPPIGEHRYFMPVPRPAPAPAPSNLAQEDVA